MKNKIRIVFTVFFLSASIALLSSCTGIEVSSRAFVELLAIEKQNGLYIVNMQFYGGGGSSSPECLSGQGETVGDAVKHAELKYGKKIFTGHIRLAVLGSEAASSLSAFSDGALPLSCPVAYSDNPANVASCRGDNLIEIINTAEQNGSFVYTTVASLASEQSSVLPIVNSDGKSSGALSFDGAVITDGKSVFGRISPSELTALRLINSDFSSKDCFLVPINTPYGAVSDEIKSAHITRKAVLDNGQLNIKVDVTIKTSISENGLNIPEAEINQALCNQLKQNCLNVYSKAFLQQKADIFGITRLARRDCGLYIPDSSNSSLSENAVPQLDITVKIGKEN